MNTRFARKWIENFLAVVMILLLCGFSLQEKPKPHWSKYKYPEKLPPGAKVHMIKKGDTLWDIARLYLSNPFLWPQIWELNKYIENADLIFPDDPIILPAIEEKAVPREEEKRVAEIPPTEVVPPAEKVAEKPEEMKEKPPAEAEPEVTPTRKEVVEEKPPAEGLPTAPALPLVTESDLYCSEIILPKKESPMLEIIGAQDRYVVGGMVGDLFYLNHGKDEGLKEGDIFFVFRYFQKIKHPKTGDNIGWGVLQLGKVVVERVNPESAILRIIHSCRPINIGDWLLPVAEVPFVTSENAPPCPNFTRKVENDKKGYIVDIEGEDETAGRGDMVNIDLGREDGVAPGDFFLVYNEDNRGETFIVVGQLIAARVGENATLCKVIVSRREIIVGQRVKRQTE